MATASSIRIDSDGIYDDDLLYAMLGVSATTLARARRQGRLRYTRQGRRVLYLGQWLLDWLTGDSTPTPGKEATHASAAEKREVAHGER